MKEGWFYNSAYKTQPCLHSSQKNVQRHNATGLTGKDLFAHCVNILSVLRALSRNYQTGHWFIEQWHQEPTVLLPDQQCNDLVTC